jgi:hypothetical protein
MRMAFVMLPLQVLTVFCTYILSIGPTVWLMAHGYLSEGMFQVVYWPIRMACGIPGVNDFFTWYMGLWCCR